MVMNKITAKIVASLALVMLSGCSSKGASSTVPDDTSKVTSESSTSSEAAISTDTSAEVQTEATTEKDLKKPTVPTKIHPIDETNIMVLSENTYKKEDVVQKTDDLLLFKPTVSLSKAFPNMKYESVSLPNDVFLIITITGNFIRGIIPRNLITVMRIKALMI